MSYELAKLLKEKAIEEIRRDMAGINPALNLYKVLSDLKEELETELKELVREQ
jgi:hypothetical protein